MVSRRSFIKGAAALSALTLSTPMLSLGKTPKKTGLALYTIRGEMSLDPGRTLEGVASLGFNWLESAGYSNGMFYGLKPAEFTALCQSAGLEHISAHLGLSENNLDEVAEDCAEAGLKYAVLPSLPRSWNSDLEGFRRAAQFMNKAGEAFRKQGVSFAFHNHSVEFIPINGVIPFKILLTETDRSIVDFELDICWITAAGIDPVAFLAANPGRFKMWHFKDMSKEKKDATLGEGVINFEPIYDLAGSSELKYHFIEQDNCLTHTPMESIEISRNYLIKKIL